MVTSKGVGLTRMYVELSLVKLAICVLPYEKHFIDGVKRIDLKLIIAIASINEYFNIILLKDG